MTKLTKEILEEFDEKFELESQGCSECGGDHLIDKTETRYPKGGYHKEYDLDKFKSFLQEVVKRVREETLEDYTKFLGKYHYVDSDVWAEEPSAIERYLSELNKKEEMSYPQTKSMS